MRAPLRTVEKARRPRRSLSAPEARLWRMLRTRGPDRPTFRRQHPIGPYVLDFYCSRARLAVEIDGASHDAADRPQRDMRRDAWLEQQGITVMRISAADLHRAFDAIVDAIFRMAVELESRAPSTAFGGPPPPLRGGG